MYWKRVTTHTHTYLNNRPKRNLHSSCDGTYSTYIHRETQIMFQVRDQTNYACDDPLNWTWIRNYAPKCTKSVFASVFHRQKNIIIQNWSECWPQCVHGQSFYISTLKKTKQSDDIIVVGEFFRVGILLAITNNIRYNLIHSIHS